MTVCNLCHKTNEHLEHQLEQVVIDLIKKRHPEWVEADGACPKCVAHYNVLGTIVDVE